MITKDDDQRTIASLAEISSDNFWTMRSPLNTSDILHTREREWSTKRGEIRRDTSLHWVAPLYWCSCANSQKAWMTSSIKRHSYCTWMFVLRRVFGCAFSRCLPTVASISLPLLCDTQPNGRMYSSVNNTWGVRKKREKDSDCEVGGEERQHFKTNTPVDKWRAGPPTMTPAF